jgi:putative salt-induced outer membrane protein YdiY
MLSCVLAALLAQAPVTTTPGAPPAAATSMTGTVALGASVLRGNSEITTFTFGSALTWKTPDWIYGFKASGAYGRSTDPNTGVESTNALNGAVSLRGARRLSEVVSIYLQGDVDTDHLKSIEWRPTGELGAALQFVDRKEGEFQTESLRVDLGFRGGYEYRFQYYPNQENLSDQAIAAPKAGFALRYAFSRAAIFADELTMLVNLPDGPRLLLNNVAKISTQLYGTVSFAVSYGIAEDSSPPRGKKQLDTTLTLALEMTL